MTPPAQAARRRSDYRGVATPSPVPSRLSTTTSERADRPPKPRVLCVDDEPQLLESLRDSLHRRFEVVVTTNGFEALRILSTEPCPVVLSDMRMPLVNGARFLTLARQHAPDTVRLLLTGQSTIDDAVAAVNQGEIFRFLLKPCPRRDLIAAIDAAVARHRTLVRERGLDEQTLQGTVRAFAQMAAAIDPSAPARAKRILQRAVELATATDMTVPSWELECACEVLQAGVIGLPAQTRTNLDGRLTPRLSAELERLPELAEAFADQIARLSPVVALLSHTAKPFVPTSPGVAGTLPGARILRIVLDFDLLEGQGMRTDAALNTLRARANRYDGRLLERFAQLQGAST